MEYKVRGFEPVSKEFRKAYSQDVDDSEIVLPLRKTIGSAGYDFIATNDYIIEANGRSAIIWTDVKVYMNPDEVFNIYVRSSLGIKHGLSLANGTGIIDSDYYSNPDNDGNIGICLRNNTDEDFVIKKGDYLVQGMFINYLVADNCNSNETRTGGVGSTGK